MKTPYTLAIGSFAVHGTAGLKTFITVLGEKVLPVPSLLLNGLTDMALVQKFETPFEELLRGSIELAVNRDLDLILYIGYLGNSGQADTILEMINTYRGCIKTIICDPVCGDHGRRYVAATVIERWPDIIAVSDFAFPNITEVKILTGHEADAEGADNTYLEQFQRLFPANQLVATGIKTAEGTISIEACGVTHFTYAHRLLPKYYGATGDAFLSLFILNRFYKMMEFGDALKLAADQTCTMIEKSIYAGSDDLIFSKLV